MISLHSAPFTLLVKLPGRRRSGLTPPRCAVRGAGNVSLAAVREMAVAEGRRQHEYSIDARLRQLAPEKVSADDRLVDYETLLVARFLDILEDLHGGDFRQVVEDCLRLSGEYQSEGDPARLGELGGLLTSLDVGDAIMVASSFSHMLNLANLAEEIQMVYRKKAEASRRGDFVDEASAPTESDIDETFQRLVRGLGKSPREVFDALRSQTIDLVLTAHPTQSVRRSLLQKHASIRSCLTQLCGEGISDNEEQEIDEALQREMEMCSSGRIRRFSRRSRRTRSGGRRRRRRTRCAPG
jgi:phosphoenolpyruvate carboxylase